MRTYVINPAIGYYLEGQRGGGGYILQSWTRGVYTTELDEGGIYYRAGRGGYILQSWSRGVYTTELVEGGDLFHVLGIADLHCQLDVIA